MSEFTIINDEDYVFELDDGPREVGLFESLMTEFMGGHELTDSSKRMLNSMYGIFGEKGKDVLI